MSSYRYQRLSIRDGGDYATVAVWSDDRQLAERQEVPPEHRKDAAQALAGDEYRVVPAKDEPVDADVMIADLRAILDALGLGDHSRPHPPHEVVQREVLPEIRRLRDEIGRLRDRNQQLYTEANQTQVDRPEPVDPSEVKVGDVVEIDFEKWGIWGEVTAKGTFHDGIGIRRYGTDEDDWINCADGTVRVLHPAEPEPDPAAVKTLAKALHATAGDGTRWHKLSDLSGWYDRARVLIRDHGVRQEVSE